MGQGATLTEPPPAGPWATARPPTPRVQRPRATPGPGAYNTPSFLLFGNQLPFKQGPTSSFTSNVRRDGSVRTKQAAIGYKHHMHERLQSNEPPMPRPGTAPHSMNPAERRRALQVRKFQPDDEPQKKPWR